MSLRLSSQGRWGRCRAWSARALLALALWGPWPSHAEVLSVPTVHAGGLEARSAALVLSGQQGGSIDLTVHSVPRLDGGTTVWLEVDPQSLPPLEAKDWLFEVHLYVVGTDSELLAFVDRAVRLSPSLLPGAPGSTVVASLRLPPLISAPPVVSLRVLWLERRSEEFGLRVVELSPTQPAATDDRAWLLPPTAVRRLDTGVLLLGEPDQPPPFPYGALGEPWIPRRALLSGERSTPFVVRGHPLDAPIDVHLLDSLGQAFGHQTLEAPLDATATTEDPRARRLDLASVPRAPAGRYRLRLTTAEAFTEQEVVFEAASSPRLDPTEPEVTTQDSGATPETDPTTVAREAEAYRLALRALVQDDPSTAGQRVARFERRALGRDTRTSSLMAIELAVAEDLARDDPELLVPLIVLHEQLYRRQHRAGDYQLATHARILVARLGERLLAKSDDAETRRLVADVLTSEAGYLLEVGSELAAQNALRAVLETDPEHHAALLLAAAVHEALGNPGAAVPLLRRLVTLEPGEAEARLRLAINQRRLGNDSRAELLLTECLGTWTADDSPGQEESRSPAPWIAALAHQELARTWLDTDRPGEALELLRRATRRFPDLPRFALQLAAALERLGDLDKAHTWLEAAAVVAQRDRDTPRLVYSRWPLRSVNTVRQRLVERQRHTLPRLAQGLGVSPETSRPAP